MPFRAHLRSNSRAIPHILVLTGNETFPSERTNQRRRHFIFKRFICESSSFPYDLTTGHYYYIISYHILYYIIFYFILFYFILFYFILFYFILFYYIILYYIILYYIILYYIILYYIILYYIILYYIILFKLFHLIQGKMVKSSQCTPRRRIGGAVL